MSRIWKIPEIALKSVFQKNTSLIQVDLFLSLLSTLQSVLIESILWHFYALGIYW